jgi:hypothetical protein
MRRLRRAKDGGSSTEHWRSLQSSIACAGFVSCNALFDGSSFYGALSE